MSEWDTDAAWEQDRAEQDRLVTPIRTEGSLRDIMEAHLTQIVNDHNQELADKAHYLQTGEVRSPAALALAPYVQRDDQRQMARLQAMLDQQRVLLFNALDGLEPFMQYSALSELTDAQFLALYGRVLLQLRAIRLPDPMPHC